jgi:hypothetical protein
MENKGAQKMAGMKRISGLTETSSLSEISCSFSAARKRLMDYVR